MVNAAAETDSGENISGDTRWERHLRKSYVEELRKKTRRVYVNGVCEHYSLSIGKVLKMRLVFSG